MPEVPDMTWQYGNTGGLQWIQKYLILNETAQITRINRYFICYCYLKISFYFLKKELPVEQAENDSRILPSPAEGRNKKYGKRKFDRIRSNINYKGLGPLAVSLW